FEKVSAATAGWAPKPRIIWATKLTLRGLAWMTEAAAFASLSFCARGVFALLIFLGPLRLLVGGMAREVPGRRELAELVADHVLGDENRQELLAVIDAKRQTHKLRQDRRAPRPGLDHFITARATRSFCLLQQITVDERTLPNRASHLVALLTC